MNNKKRLFAMGMAALCAVTTIGSINVMAEEKRIATDIILNGQENSGGFQTKKLIKSKKWI